MLIPFDPAGLDPKVVNVFDELIAALQTWAGKFESYGRWIDVPYEAAIYRAVTGAWTVNQGNHRRFRYAMFGPETMALEVVVATTTTGAGMGNDFRIRLPTGYQLKPNASGIQDSYNLPGLNHYNFGATSGIGSVWGGEQTVAPQQLRLLRDVLSPSTSWPSSVSDLTIAFTVIIPVIPY